MVALHNFLKISRMVRARNHEKFIQFVHRMVGYFFTMSMLAWITFSTYHMHPIDQLHLLFINCRSIEQLLTGNRIKKWLRQRLWKLIQLKSREHFHFQPDVKYFPHLQDSIALNCKIVHLGGHREEQELLLTRVNYLYLNQTRYLRNFSYQIYNLNT